MHPCYNENTEKRMQASRQKGDVLMPELKEELKTTNAQIEQIERDIVATKQQLADLKQTRRELYLRQSNIQQEAMAQAAAEMGLDYDTVRGKFKRYSGF